MSQCNYHFKNGTQCDQSAVKESIYCLFHDPDAWKTHAKEIIEKIKDKMQIRDYNFEGYHFPETDIFVGHSPTSEVNFKNAHFHAPISFSKANFHNSSTRGLFSGANFYEHADFTESTFQNAFFNDTQFTTANFSRFAVTGLANFSHAQFSGRVYFGLARLGITDFSEVTFSDVFFNQTRFNGRADFGNAKFQSADFTGAKFLESRFYHSNFSGRADFNNAKFGNVFFEHVTFKEANFFDAFFEGLATFFHSSFVKGNFMYARFNSDTIFIRTQFSEAFFNEAHFLRKVDFQNAQISHAKFIKTIFDDIVNFDYTHKIGEDIIQKTYWQGDFSSSIFKGTTTFKDAYLDPCFESTIMPSSNLRDVKWPPASVGFIGKEKKKIDLERKADEMENDIQKMRQYSKAISTYFFLRTRLRAEGDFIDESDFFYRERLTQRKLLNTRRRIQFKKLTDGQKEEVIGLSGGLGREYILEWIWLWIAGWTCGFGERILLIVRTFAFTLSFFALIFLIDMSSCPQTILKCLPDALYVSVGALSNMGVDVNDLGYPLSMCGKWFVQIEALTGIILTSLFLVVFVRKMSRQ